MRAPRHGRHEGALALAEYGTGCVAHAITLGGCNAVLVPVSLTGPGEVRGDSAHSQ